MTDDEMQAKLDMTAEEAQRYSAAVRAGIDAGHIMPIDTTLPTRMGSYAEDEPELHAQTALGDESAGDGE